MDQRHILCRHFHIDESDVRIVVVEALDAIIPSLPARLQKTARSYLERRGVEFMLRTPIIGALPDKVLLAGGKSIATRTFVWTCGIQGCEFAANLAITKGKCSYRKCNIAMTGGTCGGKGCTYFEGKYIEGKRGRLLVNEYMQSPDYSNVYVVGDVAWYLEGRRVIPQIVETAVQTGATAAHNIAAEISGGEMKAFKSNYHGIMVSLGTYSGVAHVMGISLTGIFAIAVKHMINVVHLFTVAGVNQVWEYVKHEFLDIRDSRSFIGGFAAYKVRGYWPLLLRLWLGFMWVVEATNKITEGWLDFSSGQSKTGWMFSPGVVQAGLKAADATSAASAAAGAARAAAAGGAVAAAGTVAVSAASAAGTAAAAADATSAASAAAGAAAGAASTAAVSAASSAAGAGARFRRRSRSVAGYDEEHPRSPLGYRLVVPRVVHGRDFRPHPVHVVPGDHRDDRAPRRAGPFRRRVHVVGRGGVPRAVRDLHAERDVRVEPALVLLRRHPDAGRRGAGIRPGQLDRSVLQELVERHTLCPQNAFLRRRADEVGQ